MKTFTGLLTQEIRCIIGLPLKVKALIPLRIWKFKLIFPAFFSFWGGIDLIPQHHDPVIRIVDSGCSVAHTPSSPSCSGS